jgi:transcriptional regulator with XRE-family HTH domain
MQTAETKVMDQQIGARLRARRLEMGYSQEKIAHDLGVSFQQVQKYEKGTNRISGSRMLQLANLLDVAPSFFLGDGFVINEIESQTLQMASTRVGARMVVAFQALPTSLQKALCEMAEALVNVGH